MTCVVVPPNLLFCARLANSLDHGVMIKRVRQDKAVRDQLGDGCHAGLVRHVTRCEDERRLLAMKVGELALKLHERMIRAGNIARPTGARPHPCRDLDHCRQSLSDVGPCPGNRWSTRSRRRAGLAVNARSRGKSACDPLKVSEHAIAPLAPQAPDRVCEKLVIVHEPASGSRAVSNSPATTIYYNSLSRHLARNTRWLPPSRGCAMSSRNASAMRSPGVSASKARTNLPSGSMT